MKERIKSICCRLSGKSIAIIGAIALIAGAAVGGTVAYMTDTSSEAKNTFNVGHVKAELTETTTDYKMTPGTDVAKDPAAEIVGDSLASWVFLKVDELKDRSREKGFDNPMFSDYMTYEITEDWTLLESTPSEGIYVYYRKEMPVEKGSRTKIQILKGKDTPESLKNGKVHVKDSVTMASMSELKTQPELTFRVYAVQRDAVEDVNMAWEIAKEAERK